MRKLKEEVFRRAFFDCSKHPGDLIGVEQFIKTSEDKGHVAKLTVKTNCDQIWHSAFDSKKWENLRAGIKQQSDAQMADGMEGCYITTVDAKECADQDQLEESVMEENLSDYQKDLIKEIALIDFESGQFTTAEFFIEDEEGDFTGVEQDAADYYQDLIDLGPAGFYEEFGDELDFDPDFVAEYADPEEEDL